MLKLKPRTGCNSWYCPKDCSVCVRKRLIICHIFLFLNISITGFEDEYPSAKDVPEFHFPVAQAEITECSTYTVVCRLKSSPPYIITSKGGSFNLPEYPNVCVSVPQKAIASKAKIPLQIKVGLLLGKSGAVISFWYTRNSATNYSFEPCAYHFVFAMESLRYDYLRTTYRHSLRPEASLVRFLCSNLVNITTSQACLEIT